MKNTFKYILLLTFFAFFVSCVKDRGNYEYNDIPKVTISDYNATVDGVKSTIYENNTLYVKKGAVLEIDPVIDFDRFNSPIFEWNFIVADQKLPAEGESYIEPIKIGDSNKLTYNVTNDPGKYIISLIISSGEYKEYINFNLSVEGPKGMAVLYKNAAGEGDFSIINTEEMDAKLSGQLIFSNIVATNNDGRKITNPKFLAVDSYSRNFMVGTSSTIEEYKKADLKLVPGDYSRFFISGQSPAAPFSPDLLRVETAGGSMYDAGFLFVNNNLYAKTRTGYGGLNLYGMLRRDITDTYSPKIIMAETVKGYVNKICFNNTTKAFELLDARGYGIDFWGMVQVYKPALILGKGKILASGTNLDLVSMGRVNSRFLCAVMKDGSSNLQLVKFVYPTANAEKNIEAEYIDNKDLAEYGITESTPWEYGSRGDYAYYAKDNKLFVLNVTSYVSIDAGLNLPVEEKINYIKLLQDELNGNHNGAVIFVATTNNGVGKVYQYRINPLSGRVNTENFVKTMENIGEVVDMHFVK